MARSNPARAFGSWDASRNEPGCLGGVGSVQRVKAISLGHAGMLVETDDGSILCDPWFLPAFHGSWCVFPRNDGLAPDLLERIEVPDFLYISHIHADHLDEAWLADHVDRSATVLLPGFPTRELEDRLRALGFRTFERTRDGEELHLTGSLRVAIHCETSITDGPGGDSALVVSHADTRLVNQNDCRTHDLDALRRHGPIDLHWLQYSGAIWYPMVYDEPPEEMRRLVDAKIESQFARALRYVEALDARAVVPSAGPPAFLDPTLFHLNVITGDEPSIFPDQRAFLAVLADAGRRGILAIPGTEIDARTLEVVHPIDDAAVDAIFTEKAAYLADYQRDWSSRIAAGLDAWHPPTPDLVDTLRSWWEPLMADAPELCAAIDDLCVLDLGDLRVAIDFGSRTVGEWDGRSPGYRFTIDRRLVETVVAERAVDWSNSLFLSCRFSAWRAGPYNEYLYNFFKSLSVERMRRAEAEARRRRSPDRDAIADEEITLGDWIVQRTCPHRGADLSVFGEIDGDELVCTLHGWRFDCASGRCLTSDAHDLRIRPATVRAD